MIRRPPRSTLSSSSAASDVYKRQSRVTAQSHASVGLRQLDEVRHPNLLVAGVKVGVGVALVVEQGLPLADHAQARVVDDRDLDRDLVDDAGRQLLVGHLETAIAVDGPDGALWLGDLGSHGGRHREAHRAQPTRVCLLYTSDAADEEDSVD